MARVSKLRDFELNSSVKRQHPSIVGFVAPGLRFNVDKYVNRTHKNVTPSAKAQRAFNMIQNYQDDFVYEGKYHIPPHFSDVEQRFLSNLLDVANIGFKIDASKVVLVKIFARTHDIVHNAGKDKPFHMTVKSIASLYGIDPKNTDALDEIMSAINFGIQEDNEICEWDHVANSRKGKFKKRPLVRSYGSKIHLSDEEMSGVVADAILYTCGFTHKERRMLWGWIQATEFARSLTPEGNPGIKYPRNQFELVAKLADMGSFYGSIEEWLRLSADFILENCFSEITSPIDFVEFEYKFFRNFVQPILRSENLPDAGIVNGRNDKAVVPQECIIGMEEKMRYLDDIKHELQELANRQITDLTDKTGKLVSGVKSLISDRLHRFLELIHPTLASDLSELPQSEPLSR